ncbi:MAG: hypothetical protein JST73_12895 [Actinobacteria bacterium]|nr:hypothetical protein [Actinomycetota bacterium]
MSLPFAIAMVLTVGGPTPARLTCVAAVGFAVASGALAAYWLDRLGSRVRAVS